MPTEKTLHDLAASLEQAGMRPPEKLIQRILEHDPAEIRAELLPLATRTEMLYQEEPACWAPLHALRLLGEVPDVDIIEPLLGRVPVSIRYEGDQPPELWTQDLLEMIARCGTAAVPILWRWSEDASKQYRSRGAALHAVAYIAHTTPEEHDALVARARHRLAEVEDKDNTTFLVYMLVVLGIADAYQEVMEAYKARRVDNEFIPAATARQYLLSNGQREDFTWHSFWELYDVFGPFEVWEPPLEDTQPES
jgi:hypothetical protein